MTGTLALAMARVEVGFHITGTTLTVDYRNRGIRLLHPSLDYQEIVVSSESYNTIDWNHLLASDLAGYPEASDDADRLGKALNYLSMYELGVSEMMTLVNIRQNQLLDAERKVILEKPLQYLTVHNGSGLPTSWSAMTVLNTTWV